MRVITLSDGHIRASHAENALVFTPEVHLENSHTARQGYANASTGTHVSVL